MKLSKLFATLSAGFVLATGAGMPAAQAATTLNMWAPRKTSASPALGKITTS